MQNFLEPQYPPRANRHSERRKFHYSLMHKHINERRADVFSFPFGLECYVLRVMKTKHKTERHSRPEGIPSLWKRINFLACTLSYNLLLAGGCRLKYKYRLQFRLGVYPDFIFGTTSPAQSYRANLHRAFRFYPAPFKRRRTSRKAGQVVLFFIVNNF